MRGPLSILLERALHERKNALMAHLREFLLTSAAVLFVILLATGASFVAYAATHGG
jgi:hypothetical protein